jgi:hypothetical protein
MDETQLMGVGVETSAQLAILLIESIQEHGAVTVFTSVFQGLLTLIIGIAIFAIIGLILD